MNNPISKYFDSLDLIAYRDYLEQEVITEYNAYMTEQDVDFEEIDSVYDVTDYDELPTWEEYESVRNFCEELENYGDFEYGEAIIHEDEWVDYIQELLVDTGYISKDFPSWIEIDWEATAENVKGDYTEATYNNETYYMRA